MSKTTIRNGRLCNQIIRNLAVSILAEKNNLHINYANYHIINDKLGIKLFIGKLKYDNTRIIKEYNYKKILDRKIDYNINLNNEYFQSYGISDIIFTHLNTSKIKNNIIEKNRFKNRYNNNNDLFIHIRLGDVKKYSPGFTYFVSCIKSIPHDNLYIGSDSINNILIRKIKYLFPYLIIIDKNEYETIQFGSTCKNIVLSHGSFSACIGYLSFFSNVYYSFLNPVNNWCPKELFLNKGWTPIKHIRAKYLHSNLKKKS